MNITLIERLAAAQKQRRRRQRLAQHALFGLLALSLLAGISRLAVPAPDVSPRVETSEMERSTYHGPAFLPAFEAYARRATALAIVKPHAAPTKIKRAAAFDPAKFADAVGTPLEEGIASYYGADFEGRPTANGEAFDPDGFTAAHRTLPLGSVIRVTNLRNERQIVVRVNDRGPYSGDRILDLSRGAAEALKMRGRGTARVRIDVL